MPTGVTYENLDVLELETSASYIDCTFSAIGQLNVNTNTFSGCDFTAISKMEGTIISLENSNIQNSNVLATNTSSRVGVSGVVSFTDSFFEATWKGGTGALLGGFQVNSSASLSFTRGHFLGQCYIPVAASSCHFISSDLSGARIAGSQYCVVLMTDCVVDCAIGGYTSLTNCKASKELTIGDSSLGLNDSVIVDGGSFAQINAKVGDNCSILPTYIKKVVYSGTPNDSTFIGCSNFWGGACLPQLNGTNNLIKNLKGIDLVKRERTLGSSNIFENVSSVTLPRSLCTVKGSINKCDASKSAKDTLIGAGGIWSSNFSYTRTNPADGGPINVMDNTTFEYAETSCPLFFSGIIRNVSLREATLSEITAPSATFINCDFRGTSLLSGDLSNSVFKNCLLEGVNTGSTVTTGWDISRSTSPGDPYTPQLNLLEGTWATYDAGGLLARTLNPRESFAISAKSSDPLFAFGLSTSYRILGHKAASSLSKGRAKVAGGVLPNSLTAKELDTLSILTGDVSEINTALTSLVSGRYYILLQNLSETPQKVYALPVNDLPSLIALGISFTDLYLMGAASAYELMQEGASEEELLAAGATPEEIVFPFALDDDTLMAWEFCTEAPGAYLFPDLSGNGNPLLVQDQGITVTRNSRTIGVTSTADNTSAGWDITWDKYGVAANPFVDEGSELTYEVLVTLQSYARTSNGEASLVSMLGENFGTYGVEMTVRGTGLPNPSKVRSVTKSGASWVEAYTTAAVPLDTEVTIKMVLRDAGSGNWALATYLDGVLQNETVMSSRPNFNADFYPTVGRRSYAWTGESTTDILIKAVSISKTARV
jgi:hypothetical protein